MFADAFRLDRESALSSSASGIAPSIRRRSTAEDKPRHETGDERREAGRALFFIILLVVGIVFIIFVVGLVLVEIEVIVVIGGGLE